MVKPKSIKKDSLLDDDSIDELGEDEAIPFEYSVTSYGADYTVEGIVSKLRKGTVFVPHFQREYVWNITQASRFIESLLLGLPVPGIFLSKESATERLLIVDGQQRLKSLLFFYDGIFKGTEFSLQETQSKFKGKTYKTLNPEDRLRLDDSVLHATIVKQERPSEDDSSIYHVFERLNTGGTPLYPQEIRACIYHGDFNDYLIGLRNNPSWKIIYGTMSPRMKDAELILRFFALYFREADYKRPMKKFLNSYMSKNRNLKFNSKEVLDKKFNNSISLMAKTIGKKAFRIENGPINAAVFDAVMIGLTQRLDRGIIENNKMFESYYYKLLQDKEFLDACQTGTSDEGKVTKRIRLATEGFISVD